MVSLFAACVLAATPPTDAPVKLVSTGFASVRVAPELTTSFAETFALRLSQAPWLRVTTPRDVASVLGVERQKQLSGCAEESTTCLAELAGALGADAVLAGEVARVGSFFQVSTKVLSAKDGRVLFQSLDRLKTEDEVLESLDRRASEALASLRLAFAAQLAAAGASPARADGTVEEAAGRSSPLPGVLLGTGVALAVVGVVGVGLGALDYQQLDRRAPSLTQAQAQGLVRDGELKQRLGLGALAGGVVAVGAGLVVRAVGRPASTTSMSVGATADGVFVGATGRF